MLPTDTPPGPTPTAPLTPLGARTPHAHPALYGVIAFFSLVIVAGAVWAFWPHPTVAPELSPTPSISVSTSPLSTSIYDDARFGLHVTLSDDWRGVREIGSEGETLVWHAMDVATGAEVATGPTVVLRHPLWTEARPYEDLPILVFTLEQWSEVERGNWSVSAAPIPPTELARNTKYVFALPARYNYDALLGWEEVDRLIRNGAVSALPIEPMGLRKRTASDDLVFYDGWTAVSGTFGISNPANDEFGSSLMVSFSVDEATSARIPRVPGDVRDAWFRLMNDAQARAMLGIDAERFKDPSCSWQGGTATIEIGSYIEDLRQTETTDRALLLRVVNADPATCSTW